MDIPVLEKEASAILGMNNINSRMRFLNYILLRGDYDTDMNEGTPDVDLDASVDTEMVDEDPSPLFELLYMYLMNQFSGAEGQAFADKVLAFDEDVDENRIRREILKNYVRSAQELQRLRLIYKEAKNHENFKNMIQQFLIVIGYRLQTLNTEQDYFIHTLDKKKGNTAGSMAENLAMKEAMYIHFADEQKALLEAYRIYQNFVPLSHD